jgi:hypothetical protein
MIKLLLSGDWLKAKHGLWFLRRTNEQEQQGDKSARINSWLSDWMMDLKIENQIAWVPRQTYGFDSLRFYLKIEQKLVQGRRGLLWSKCSGRSWGWQTYLAQQLPEWDLTKMSHTHTKKQKHRSLDHASGKPSGIITDKTWNPCRKSVMILVLDPIWFKIRKDKPQGEQ